MCTHTPAVVAGTEVVACADCGEVAWFRDGRWLDPAEGMAALFGEYDLVGRLEALSAPAAEVLLYRPPSKRWRSHLEAFPKHVWLEASPDLFLSHDGEHLLLAPLSHVYFDNLTRGA